jgi:hypothetical protein
MLRFAELIAAPRFAHGERQLNWSLRIASTAYKPSLG